MREIYLSFFARNCFYCLYFHCCCTHKWVFMQIVFPLLPISKIDFIKCSHTIANVPPNYQLVVRPFVPPFIRSFPYVLVPANNMPPKAPTLTQIFKAFSQPWKHLNIKASNINKPCSASASSLCSAFVSHITRILTSSSTRSWQLARIACRRSVVMSFLLLLRLKLRALFASHAILL